MNRGATTVPFPELTSVRRLREAGPRLCEACGGRLNESGKCMECGESGVREGGPGSGPHKIGDSVTHKDFPGRTGTVKSVSPNGNFTTVKFENGATIQERSSSFHPSSPKNYQSGDYNKQKGEFEKQHGKESQEGGPGSGPQKGYTGSQGGKGYEKEKSPYPKALINKVINHHESWMGGPCTATHAKEYLDHYKGSFQKLDKDVKKYGGYPDI